MTLAVQLPFCKTTSDTNKWPIKLLRNIVLVVRKSELSKNKLEQWQVDLSCLVRYVLRSIFSINHKSEALIILKYGTLTSHHLLRKKSPRICLLLSLTGSKVWTMVHEKWWQPWLCVRSGFGTVAWGLPLLCPPCLISWLDKWMPKSLLWR